MRCLCCGMDVQALTEHARDHHDIDPDEPVRYERVETFLTGVENHTG